MEYSFLLVICNALLLLGAGAVFISPLRKREKWFCWLPVVFALCVLVMDLGYRADENKIFLYHLLTYGVLLLLVNRCTTISWVDDLYCAVWIFLTAEAVQELWFLIRLYTHSVHAMDLRSAAELLAFAAVLFLILSRTVARWMPQGDLYQVTPGQVICGFILGGMFIALSYLIMLPSNEVTGEVPVLALCQIYCVSLLYLQTELMKKRQMERKLDMMNLLCSFGAQQYAVALHNVGVVNEKCAELEEKIRQMDQYLPEAFRQESRSAIQEALVACDTVVKSGNEVLDIVLTEKKLLAQSSGTQINCVADGKLLGFMETVDIYTLFSYALEMAVEEVSQIADENRRIVDLLIHESQNFAVISFCHPLRSQAVKSKNNLNGFKIMVLYRLLEKYHGITSIERKDGFFSMKILIPLSQNKK